MVKQLNVLASVIREDSRSHHGILNEFGCEADVVQVSAPVWLHPCNPQFTWIVMAVQGSKFFCPKQCQGDYVLGFCLHLGCFELVRPLRIDVIVETCQPVLNSHLI